LVGNILILPLSVLLAPLPGPNIIGYWFLYRAVCHVLALLGIRKARAGTAPETFCADASLDVALDGPGGEVTARIASTHGLSGFVDFLNRTSPSTSEPAESHVS
jgi:hypothetical protein